MKDGTKEDYLLLNKHEKKFIESTAERIIKFMSGLTKTLECSNLFILYPSNVLVSPLINFIILSAVFSMNFFSCLFSKR